MKLYVFEPNCWDRKYIVMCESKKDALEYLLASLKKEADNKRYKHKSDYDTLKQWSSVDVDEPLTYPRNYSIEEYKVGDVLEVNEE